MFLRACSPKEGMPTRPRCSELQLCSSPVSPLGVVPDFVVSLVSDPVGHWSVLLDLFCQSHLLSECLNGPLKAKTQVQLTI